MDLLFEPDLVALPVGGEETVEFEHVFNDELAAMAGDKDLDELHRLWQKETSDYLRAES